MIPNNHTQTDHEHVIAVLVENHPGVLARISGMFAARGYNIESLAVGTTQHPTVSQITVALRGEDKVISQIVQQLSKMVDVIRVMDMSDHVHIERELMLIKVASNERRRSEIMQICDIFRARIVDVGHESLVIEVVGTLDKNEALRELFEPFGILEMTRTGRVAVQRGVEVLRPPDV